MLQNINQFYSIAPMMGKTDSYFCFLMSLINNNITIYTEMMHSEAVIRTNILNDYKILKNFSNIKVQIAGNKPIRMAKAAKKISELGFAEVNINCGCPSKSVIAGDFGLILLKNPKIVKDCVNAIKNETDLKVSVKTRIGIGTKYNDDLLNNFVSEINMSGVNKYIIHARNGVCLLYTSPSPRDS